jgi:hypothetical protein
MEMEEPILKFIWIYKRPQIAKIVLKKKKSIKQFLFPNIKIYNRAAISRQYISSIRTDNASIELRIWK